MRMKWLIFVFGAMACWGMYGPVLHMGQGALGGSAMRAMLCVGLAYFLIGVMIPGGIIMTGGDPGGFTTKGMIIASVAGVLGAVGALCITYAFRNQGLPIYVMPLVFGGAPVVNVVFSLIKNPPKSAPSPWLYAGFILVAVGASMILRYKPS